MVAAARTVGGRWSPDQQLEEETGHEARASSDGGAEQRSDPEQEQPRQREERADGSAPGEPVDEEADAGVLGGEEHPQTRPSRV